MKALDLFCGAGGASMGLHRAGFDVTGVDIAPQKRYPFRFVQADALTFPLSGFDFIWASPPCQGYTALRHAPGAKGAPLLIEAVRARLIASGAIWCIENVEGATWALRDPITLCGSMFGLGAQGCRLQRHRLVECSFRMAQPSCRHDGRPIIGVYGAHSRRRAASAGGRGTRDVWIGGHKAAAAQAIGINWMTLAEISEAVPPAFSEYIGRAAIGALRDVVTPLRAGARASMRKIIESAQPFSSKMHSRFHRRCTLIFMTVHTQGAVLRAHARVDIGV